MVDRDTDYGLEFLLSFDGRVHHLEKGYWIKFEIKRVKPARGRSHGLSYALTLHAPDGTRLIGFDNGVPAVGSKFKRWPEENDHWHRTEKDSGRPCMFKDAAKLIDDFFDEVERVLREHGVGMEVVSVEQTGRPK
jgi:hypothetical protein